MARSRMIRPEFWDDEKLSKLSRDARLTFIGTWNHSDDYGVVKGNNKWLNSKIYPYDNTPDKTFDGWIDQLVKMGALIPFNDNGESYYYIKNFLKHQKVNRPSKQRNPEPPPQILEDSLNNHGVLIDETETEVKQKQKQKQKQKVDYPVWLNMELWKEFKKHRTLIKSPMSERAEKLCLADLKKLVADGESADSCINQTIKSGKWKSFHPSKDQDTQKTKLYKEAMEYLKTSETNFLKHCKYNALDVDEVKTWIQCHSK